MACDRIAGLLVSPEMPSSRISRASSPESIKPRCRSSSQTLWPSFVDGRLRPILDRAVPVHEVEQALDYVASDASVGKVVLSWNDAELEAT